MNLCINPECQQPRNSDTTIFCKGCGSELLLDGRYRVIRELGQGGFGTTYEILDLNSHPRVLKVLTDNHPKYVELFKQESQVLSILNHHGIPKIDLDGYFLYFPEGRTEPMHCLVMEKIEGLNLRQYVEQRGNRPIKPKRVLRWLAELILILERVHAKNFFHRDIKPSNIMLRVNGCLALIDFGTVREVDKSYLQKQAAGEITGVVTQGYTPTEQMRGKAVLQSDFYALGGTAIYLLTAQNPSKFYDALEDKIIWREGVPNISPGFADLIDRLIAFLPSKRPASARSIFEQIIAIDSSLQILDEHFNYTAVKSKVAQNTDATNPLTSNFSTTTKSALYSSLEIPITPEFIERCRRELAEYIGPMANIVCKRAVKQSPTMSEKELYETLAKAIENPQQAREFQSRFS